MNFQDLNLTGLDVLTGKRNVTNDPNEAVRVTPTSGKISLSDGFITDSGYMPNSHVVVMALPKNYDFGVARTFPEGTDNVYAIAPGFGVKENGRDGAVDSYGNYLSDGSGSGVSFTSQSSWQMLRGTTDGSLYFSTHAVFGIAIVNDAFVVITNKNKATLPQDAQCVVWKCNADGLFLDVNNPMTVSDSLKRVAVYALQYEKFEAKSVKGEGKGTDEAEPTTKEVAEQVDAIGEDFTFDETGDEL